MVLVCDYKLKSCRRPQYPTLDYSVYLFLTAMGKQLKLFFGDLQSRARINNLFQFRKGDRFHDYTALDAHQLPTVIEITENKKYRGPLTSVSYRRLSAPEEVLSIDVLSATGHVDTRRWLQIDQGAGLI